MDKLNHHTILYRPVGLEEMALIYDSGMKTFPARLPNQPIFYPVLDLEYARQVASDWNVKHGQFAGYVTQFKVEDEHIDKFEKHTVGGSQHQEFWIPAEDVDEFNKHIVGNIKVLEAYFGDEFKGFIPDQFGLQGKNAVEQFTLLTNSYIYKRMDFYLEIKRNHKAIFLNFPFWQTYDFKNPTLKEKILQAIKEAWFTSFPKNPLAINPVREDTAFIKQTDTVPTESSVDDDLALDDESDSDSSVEAEPDDDTPDQQEEFASFETPDDEDDTPAKERDLHSSVEPVHHELPPVKQNHVSPLKPPVQIPSPVERRDSHFLGNAARKDITPVERTGSRFEAPRKNDSHIQQGVQLGLKGKYEEAIDALSRVVEENPKDVVARTSLGVAFHRSGNDERSLALYEDAINLNPTYAEAHYFQANVLYGQGDVREAIAGYTTAIGLDPRLIEAHQNPVPGDRLTDYIGTPAELIWIAKPARRILYLDRSIEKNPGDANLFKERAAHYSRLWNYEQAIADYSAALKLRPDDANALHARGLAYEQIGQHDRASQDFQRAVAINPQLSDEFLIRGVNFGKAGNLRQSITSLSEGIRLAPENPDGYFNRGITYFYQGDFDRAIDDFADVIRLAPQDDAAYYWRGIAYEESGRRAEAITDYRQFLNLSQDPRLRDEIEQRLSPLNESRRNSVSTPTALQEDNAKTNAGESEKSYQKPDIYQIVAALGERALSSTWFVNELKCVGEKAAELYALTENNRSIEGGELLRLASGISETKEGDFTAFDPEATAGWILIRAWGGSGFYIQTNDPQSKRRLKARFPSSEEIEGVDPPYEGLFIHI